MLAAQKRLWIEILLHLLFWAGIFYVLASSLDNSHIQIYARRPGPHIASDHADEAVSAYVYIILLSLALLFYGNVFG